MPSGPVDCVCVSSEIERINAAYDFFTWCQKIVKRMAAHHLIPPPSSLQIHDVNAALLWRKWRAAWHNFELATGVEEKPEKTRIATLLAVIGEDANTVYDGFEWSGSPKTRTVEEVLKKFEDYCTPQINIPYERHRFHSRVQLPGEDVLTWLTDLRSIGKNCDFTKITVDEIFRDQLVAEVNDQKVRNKLLDRRSLNLHECIDIVKTLKSCSKDRLKV